jgi:histone acetyltransferase (RNA polymerase elongator complex component)
VITVLTSPYPEVDGVAQKFSCAWNCYYCPAEPGQPRSYLHDEPAVRRANQNAFDPVLQFTDRCVGACVRTSIARTKERERKTAR